LLQKQADIDMAYSDLENIAHLASHDLRTPLNNIISLAHLIQEEFGETIGDSGKEYISYVNEASYYMSDLLSSIHSYSKASKLAVDVQERVKCDDLIDEMLMLLKVPANFIIDRDFHVNEIIVPVLAVKQILFHLLLNALQYNDKKDGKITITISENDTEWIISITDNGEGIAGADLEKMYSLFRRLRNRDKNGENMGIGLAIVKRLAEKMHGTVSVTSTMGTGSTFTVSIPK
jgi:signal transduction histidine kinase